MRAILDIILIALNFYVYIIIGSAIFSWLYAFNVINSRNQFVGMLGNFFYQMTEPLLRPIRRFMPNLGSIDISPIILIFGVYFVQRVIILYIYPYVF